MYKSNLSAHRSQSATLGSPCRNFIRVLSTFFSPGLGRNPNPGNENYIETKRRWGFSRHIKKPCVPNDSDQHFHGEMGWVIIRQKRSDYSLALPMVTNEWYVTTKERGVSTTSVSSKESFQKSKTNSLFKQFTRIFILRYQNRSSGFQNLLFWTAGCCKRSFLFRLWIFPN